MISLLTTSILYACGLLLNPGIVIISPVLIIIKPAPLFTFKLRTVISKFFGAPKILGLSVKDTGVLAKHIGN
jgi:hypothetical protein